MSNDDATQEKNGNKPSDPQMAIWPPLQHDGLEFTSEQLEAILHRKGHLCIIACPGSGKTEVVSQRISKLIQSGVPPETIVAFTFTEKAAESLKLRIRRIIQKDCSNRSDVGGMFIGTIDSFCLYLLKRLRPEYRSFEVLDEAKRMAFMDRWYYALGLQSLESTWMGKWRVIKQFCRDADLVLTEAVDLSGSPMREFAECYNKYTDKLSEERFFDFTTIIHTLLQVLESDSDALARLNREVKHVVFDEYQDVNRLQELLLEKLSIGSDSVCVVGDDDQNIFQWRGSDVRHILGFVDRYKKYGAKMVRIGKNFRATKALVETAELFIANNTSRIDKKMAHNEKSLRTSEDGDMLHKHFDTDLEEFEFIVEKINSLVGTEFIDKYNRQTALSLKDFAIIVSTNEDAARVMSFLEQHGIRCLADSGSGIFDGQAVSLALDCISFVFRCPGYTTGNDIPTILDLKRKHQDLFGKEESEKFAKSLLKVKAMAKKIIRQGRLDYLPNLGLQEFYQRILNAMGAERGIFDELIMYNLAVLSRAISDYEYVYQRIRAREIRGLKWFVFGYASSGYSDPQHSDPGLFQAVRVLTIWKAKGLEFPVVFIPTFVKKQKKRNFSFVDAELYESDRYAGSVEDERRAFYTAITRSEKYLFLTGAKQRKIVVKSNHSIREIHPHPFIGEIVNSHFSKRLITDKPKCSHEIRQESEKLYPTSYSQLSIYDRCPYDFKLRHVHGFNAGVPAPFGYGRVIHNIINVIHNNYIQRKNIPTEKEIEELVDKMFHLRFAPGTMSDKMKKSGLQVVKNYVELHKDDFDKILETEKRFEFISDNSMITGEIDLLKKINGAGEVAEVEIIDFKTEKADGKGRYEMDHSEQVRFYSYASKKSLGYKPEKAVIHHLDTSRKEVVDITEGELEKTSGRIKSKVDLILGKEFTATPEKAKCAGCDFKAICQFKGFEVGAGFKD